MDSYQFQTPSFGNLGIISCTEQSNPRKYGTPVAYLVLASYSKLSDHRAPSRAPVIAYTAINVNAKIILKKASYEAHQSYFNIATYSTLSALPVAIKRKQRKLNKSMKEDEIFVVPSHACGSNWFCSTPHNLLKMEGYRKIASAANQVLEETYCDKV